MSASEFLGLGFSVLDWMGSEKTAAAIAANLAVHGARFARAFLMFLVLKILGVRKFNNINKLLCVFPAKNPSLPGKKSVIARQKIRHCPAKNPSTGNLTFCRIYAKNIKTAGNNATNIEPGLTNKLTDGGPAVATGEIVKPREIVKANNELFRCKYKIKDIVAGRIFMAFASLVDHKDVKENQNFVEYQIAASSIMQGIDAGGDYYDQIRAAAYSLVDHKIEQRFNKKNFVVYTLFSKIEYRDGIIKGEFHKDLVPFFIIARTKFTKLKLQEYMNLPSIYSQAIYGFLKSWDDKEEVTVNLSELHTMLDTPQSFKKDFYEFKRRVLDKAHKDINEKTSLSYEWEPIKNGRSYSHIKFMIKKRENQFPSNSQTGNISKSALEFEPVKNSIQPRLNAFCAKFQDGNRKHLEAGIKWYELQKKGIEPLAEDVPANNELGIIEFLEQWKTSHEQAKK